MLALLLGVGGCAPTELTLTNNSSTNLEFVTWGSVYFGTESVYEPILGLDVTGLNAGATDTQGVPPGADQVHFQFCDDITDYHTVDTVTVRDGEHITFELLGSTQVRVGFVLLATRQSADGETHETYEIVADGTTDKAARVRAAAAAGASDQAPSAGAQP